MNSDDFRLSDAIIPILILLCIPVFIWGRHQGFADGYTAGTSYQSSQDKGLYDANSNAAEQLTQANQDLQTLTDQYNTLSDNYNNLRNAVIRYVGTAGSYQPSTHVSCTSNAIGTYTYTNCY